MYGCHEGPEEGLAALYMDRASAPGAVGLSRLHLHRGTLMAALQQPATQGSSPLSSLGCTNISSSFSPCSLEPLPTADDRPNCLFDNHHLARALLAASAWSTSQPFPSRLNQAQPRCSSIPTCTKGHCHCDIALGSHCPALRNGHACPVWAQKSSTGYTSLHTALSATAWPQGHCMHSKGSGSSADLTIPRTTQAEHSRWSPDLTACIDSPALLAAAATMAAANAQPQVDRDWSLATAALRDAVVKAAASQAAAAYAAAAAAAELRVAAKGGCDGAQQQTRSVTWHDEVAGESPLKARTGTQLLRSISAAPAQRDWPPREVEQRLPALRGTRFACMTASTQHVARNLWTNLAAAAGFLEPHVNQLVHRNAAPLAPLLPSPAEVE
ncbi:hypothetical protein V8C86DRAFT_182288 [Haematococcus lacustris]